MKDWAALTGSERPVAFIYPSYSVNSYGVMRSLGEAGIPVVAFDDTDTPNFRSRYCTPVRCPSPTEDPRGFIDFLADTARQFRTPPVLYLLEDLYVYLAHRHRERLEPYVRFPFLEEAALLDCIDKQRSFAALAGSGVPLPATWYPRTRQELIALKDALRFPAIVKPLVARFDYDLGDAEARASNVCRFPHAFGNKALRADTFESLLRRFEQVHALGIACCVQELIPGPTEALVGTTCYVDPQGRVHGMFTYTKLRQTPWDFGTMTLGRALDCPEAVELSERAVRALRFTGICGIEFKRDERDGSYRFIEINPRAELWVNLASRCGVNLPLLQYRDLSGEPGRAVQTDFDKQLLDLRDDFSQYFMRYRRRSSGAPPLSLGEWLRTVSRPNTDEVIFNWRDPAPGLGRFTAYLGGVWQRRRARRGHATPLPRTQL